MLPRDSPFGLQRGMFRGAWRAFLLVPPTFVYAIRSFKRRRSIYDKNEDLLYDLEDVGKFHDLKDSSLSRTLT